MAVVEGWCLWLTQGVGGETSKAGKGPLVSRRETGAGETGEK